ncbi:MAG: M23 family metallopeptidase [Candidatus Lernaella stagnicola]|nr:M23 family metallopeptidase [Candidatus Lernaella stagnicola]
MADFDDYRPSSGRPDHFTRSIIIIALALGLVVLSAYFLFSDNEDDDTPPALTPIADTPVEDAAPTPVATPEPTPEPTPLGPPSYVQHDKLHVLAFRIEGSLTASIKRALPDQYQDTAGTLARRLADAMRWRLNPRRDLRSGDQAKIVFNPDAKTERAPIYGFWYRSKRLEKELRFIYFPQAKGTPSPYFDPEGVNIAQQLKRPPLGATALAEAGIANLGTKGMRFSVPTGTQVSMPYPARVIRRNWDMANLGRCVEARYLDSGYTAWFCHLDTLGEGTSDGAIIGSGNAFATVGATGKTRGPALLYRVFKPQEGDDPQPASVYELHGKEEIKLVAADRVAFVAVVSRVDQLFELVQVPEAEKAD